MLNYNMKDLDKVSQELYGCPYKSTENTILRKYEIALLYESRENN
jgi:hypothetical protein